MTGSPDPGTSPVPPSAGAPGSPSAATPSAGPTIRATATPSSGPASGSPAWHRIGAISATSGGNVARLVATADGYVASEDGDGPTVDWLSTDGRSWSSGDANLQVPPCPPVDSSCSSWPTDGGWLAIASTDTISVLRSPDGLTWTSVPLPADVTADLDGTGWAAPDGTLLLLLDPSHQGTAVSLGAVDPSGTWRSVPYPATCPGSYELVLPPAAGQPRWAISDGSAVCVSSDLTTWSRSVLPIKAGFPIVDWVSTSHGILATGSDSDCVCDHPFQFLSRDGVHWTKLRTAIGTTVISDGPAGILGIVDNRDKVANQFLVWRLSP